MIAECPINIECKFVRNIELPTNSILVGEIMETYVNKECRIAGDILDIDKIKPVFYSFYDNQFRTIGPSLNSQKNNNKEE